MVQAEFEEKVLDFINSHEFFWLTELIRVFPQKDESSIRYFINKLKKLGLIMCSEKRGTKRQFYRVARLTSELIESCEWFSDYEGYNLYYKKHNT